MKFLPSKSLLFLALFGFFISFSSCTKENASDVNQDRIYTEYELFYDKNTDKTTAFARFKFGGATGTLLELDSTAFVTFNGDKLPYNALLAVHMKEYAGLVTSGKFVYTNINEDVFENSVPAFEAIEFPTIDAVKRTQSFDLKWTGTALSADQSVGLAINGNKEGDLQLFVQTAVGSSSIVLAKTQLEKLGLGEATGIMDRSTSQKVKQGTSVGGYITGKYRAQNAKLNITD